MDTQLLDVATKFLGEAAQSALTKDIALFTFAWFIVRRKVDKYFGKLNEHFGRIESELSGVSRSVMDLSQSLQKLETNHAGRLTRIEHRMEKVETHIKLGQS